MTGIPRRASKVRVEKLKGTKPSTLERIARRTVASRVFTLAQPPTAPIAIE